MCELLVRVRDKPAGGEPVRDARRSLRGDVIAVVADGHDWAAGERREPQWVIFRVPGMSVAEGEALAKGEPDDGTGRPLHRRLFRLGLDRLPAHLLPLTRVPEPRGHRAAEAVAIDADTLRAIALTKPPVPDLAVIGGKRRHPDVIGG